VKNSAVCWKLRVSLCYSLCRLEQFSVRCISENAGVRTISREVAESPNQAVPLTPQRLHAELLETSASGARAYLHGAAHDATISGRHRTVRFGQSDVRWLAVLKVLLDGLGRRSWNYREGRSRSFWVLETSAEVLAERPTCSTQEERLAYARGYFDAEGGTPRDPSARFYLQFVQKDHGDIDELRRMLMLEGIDCGRIHNPSRQVDPNLWRFYVLASGHEAFATLVSSWHPRKRSLLEARFGFERRG
jgi:hypothetical protein